MIKNNKNINIIKKSILSVLDFPKKGINFKDVTPILSNPKLLKLTINELANLIKKEKIDVIVAPESRGFWFGIPLALKLNIPFVPIRKKDKLPRKTVGLSYKLEYNTTSLFIHRDDIKKNANVLLVDDIIATGGTIIACKKIINNLLKAKLKCVIAVAGISGLNGLKEINKNKIKCKTLFNFN